MTTQEQLAIQRGWKPFSPEELRQAGKCTRRRCDNLASVWLLVRLNGLDTWDARCEQHAKQISA